MAIQWQTPGTSYRPWIDTVPPVYNRPIQGTYGNCPFIAALSAVGWINYDFIRSDTGYHDWSGGVNGFGFWFWYTDTPGGAGEFTKVQEVRVNSDLEFNTTSGLWSGSTSRTPFETWVAIYEKAYAKFRQWVILKGYTPFYTPPPSPGNPPPFSWNPLKVADYTINPDSPGIMLREHWGGNPLVVSAHLVGGLRLSNFRDIKNYAKGDSYTFIKTNYCYNHPAKKGAKTKVPMTVWTYPDDASLKNATGIASYSGSGIAANHSYAVLGILKTGTSPNEKYYIILRDTFTSDPSGSVISTADTLYYMEQEFQLPNYSYQTAVGIIPTAASLALSGADGVFAIRCDQTLDNFKSYFQTYCWITKP